MEHGFKHWAQWVVLGSLSSGERTQWVPLSLLFLCQSKLTEFFFAELTEFAVKLSEAQWVLFSRNSTLETVFRHCPIFGTEFPTKSLRSCRLHVCKIPHNSKRVPRFLLYMSGMHCYCTCLGCTTVVHKTLHTLKNKFFTCQPSERIKHAPNWGPPFRVTFCPQFPRGGTQWIHTSGKKNSINMNFLLRISRGHSWPLRPPRGQKVSPHHQGHRKTHFLVRTSTIFGPDVHDPKGCRKTLYKKSLRWFFCPQYRRSCRNSRTSVFQRIAKGAGGKGPRQKTSKIVKKCQKVFRHFSTIFAQGKKRQKTSKVSKSFSTLFDNFRAAPVFRPLLQSTECFRYRKRASSA